MQQKKNIQATAQKSLLKKVPFRIVIYPKDIENIMGCTSRTAYRIIRIIRKILGKQRHQSITIKEFSEFQGISEEIIIDFLLN